MAGNWGEHKKVCRVNPLVAGRPDLISWNELEDLGGESAVGKILEVRIIAQPPPFPRYSFPGKDRYGEVRRVLVCAETKPEGVELGKNLRWSNPRIYRFQDGSYGARIEDADVGDVTIVAD